MSELQNLIAQTYEKAKRGRWTQVLSEWRDAPLIARRCSRYRNESSGWTFLHQAAYFEHEIACRELIRLGASVGRRSREGKTAADVAQEKGYTELAALLRRALLAEESLWAGPADPDLRPSSNLWSEGTERRATEVFLVSYAGGAVKIPSGARYFVDSFGRVLVGWHGTYDPPCGMDGESML